MFIGFKIGREGMIVGCWITLTIRGEFTFCTFDRDKLLWEFCPIKGWVEVNITGVSVLIILDPLLFWTLELDKLLYKLLDGKGT